MEGGAFGSINILEKRGSNFNYSEERRYTLVTLCNGAERLFGVSSVALARTARPGLKFLPAGKPGKREDTLPWEAWGLMECQGRGRGRSAEAHGTDYTQTNLAATSRACFPDTN
ncbi:hypothetical protein KM043_011918 [Ampulex compressa]|nr:hypothetical protein KM043_011918 [Ampulex compressa]